MLLRLTPPSAPPLRRRSYILRRSVPCQTELRLSPVRHKPRPLHIRSSSLSPEGGSVDSRSDELEKLLSLLPDEMQEKLVAHPELHRLIEIVMDLGREPLARFPSGDFLLSYHPITFGDLSHATSQVGDFAADNRAGISRTLHRISAVRNRKGSIVGLTCRVGRAVSGSANSLRELVEGGASLLLIGPPGVGKTTIIRDIARMLADDYTKRVMIVDTSNEIGGDGDIPHPGIGNARRMQVPDANMQHKVLIEAVENHMPQAIIIDEIGTKLEAMAASTIAQRGIQLVASAHGITIENLMMNPSLEMLVGGIQSVTLGDEEASRRGVRKTVLERKGPSTFACGVEIISKTELRIHRSLEATVDALLAGRSPKVEVHKITNGMSTENTALPKGSMGILSYDKEDEATKEEASSTSDEIISSNFIFENTDSMVPRRLQTEERTHLFIYGILEASVLQAVKQMRMDETIQLTDDISEADAFLALHSKIKKNSRIQAVARSYDIPIYVTKTCSLEQIAKALRSLLAKHTDGLKHSVEEGEISSPERLDALEEARLAIERIVIPQGEYVELLPRPSYIILSQIELIQKYNLKFVKVGKEPNVLLRILPMSYDTTVEIDGGGDASQQHNASSADDMDSSNSGLSRLPLLPE